MMNYPDESTPDRHKQRLQNHLSQVLLEIKNSAKDIEAFRDTLSQPEETKNDYMMPDPTPNFGATIGFMVASKVKDADIRKNKVEREEGESYKIAINRIDKLIAYLQEEKNRLQQELSDSKTPFLLNYIPQAYHTQKGAIVKQLELAFEGRHYQQLANKIIDLCRAGKMRWPIALASRAEQPLSECVDYDENFFEQFIGSIPQKYQVNYSSFQKAMYRAIELY